MDFAQRPELVPLGFVGVFAFVSIVLAHVGGWRDLAALYASNEAFDGRRWILQSARMRWGAGYNNALTVGVNANGLRLAVMFPFRLAHPPLFIPWSEITAENRKEWFRQGVELRFARASGVPLVISRRLADRIASEVGSVFRWVSPIECAVLRRPGWITTRCSGRAAARMEARR